MENRYFEEVKAAIKSSIDLGAASFSDVLLDIGSPDPRLVKKLYDEIVTPAMYEDIAKSVVKINDRAVIARRLTAQLPLQLPAPDPLKSQWWFTLDSISKLAKVILKFAHDNPIAFIGAPTVGFYVGHWMESEVNILDADQDIIDSLKVPNNVRKLIYDVNNAPPEELENKHAVVVVDPPWYPQDTLCFIKRSLNIACVGGYILCVLPPRLTRPSAIKERTDLIETLISNKFEIVGIESAFVMYTVPEFEALAYGDLENLVGRNWRQGDLLILRVASETRMDDVSTTAKVVESFSRDSKKLRYFVNCNSLSPELADAVESIEKFKESVSARLVDRDTITAWGTNQCACKTGNIDALSSVLDVWSEGGGLEVAIATLEAAGTAKEPRVFASSIDEALGLWTFAEGPACRRTPVELADVSRKILADIASVPTKRDYTFEDDGFRMSFQRDRDRVLWSNGLKRLSNKSQLFPVTRDDHLRRRLTHTIEVMQLSSTIAVSFGLDKDLTEAGALAHDIGHTPFGHAGEFALDRIWQEIAPNLGGFNHYEHGVDIVRWLEDVYQSPGVGGFPGLNLTFETLECILKHSYSKSSGRLSQSIIIQNSKHSDIKDDYCHLEGQAVRIADKISYLISDIEDGIRLGLFTYDDLMTCRLFHRPPIDMAPAPMESLYDRFVSQRRAILKVVMEDILKFSDKKVSKLKSPSDARTLGEYAIDYSPEIKEDLSEIWRKLQAGKLHNNPVVRSENIRAAQIVRDLFILYCLNPSLITSSFRDSHKHLSSSNYINWYVNKMGGNKIGIPKELATKYSYEHALGANLEPQGGNYLIHLHDFVLAKDFVASLTDTSATQEHERYVSGRHRA